MNGSRKLFEDRPSGPGRKLFEDQKPIDLKDISLMLNELRRMAEDSRKMAERCVAEMDNLQKKIDERVKRYGR